MDMNIRKTLNHWINGIINHNHFTYDLIKYLDENGKANVNSTITIDDHVYDLNIILKQRKKKDTPIVLTIDVEDLYRKIQELNKKEDNL